ncbi:MAG: hypothetical protein AABY15_02830 [Nanoarchaeota archaeon]
MNEVERNRRLLILLDKLISSGDLESFQLIESLVKNDTEAMKYTFKLMKKSLDFNLNIMRLRAIKYHDGVIFTDDKKPSHGETNYVQYYPMTKGLQSIVEVYDQNKHYPAITRIRVIAQSTDLNIIGVPYVNLDNAVDKIKEIELELTNICVQTGGPCGYPCNGEENCRPGMILYQDGEKTFLKVKSVIYD